MNDQTILFIEIKNQMEDEWSWKGGGVAWPALGTYLNNII